MNDDLKESHGVHFLEQSSLRRSALKHLATFGDDSAPLVKQYPAAPTFELPRRAWKLSEARIQPLLQQRRSLRTYSPEPVKLVDLAFILWACQGVSARAGKHLLRTSPSAGARYPVETYLSVRKVEGLAAGIYHFDPLSFSLACIAEGSHGDQVAAACLDQMFMKQAAFTFIWSGILRRSMSKYGERGVRYLFLDAAHICQSALLASEAVDCGGCPVAAFYDNEISELLELEPASEVVLYLASIGVKP